MQEPYGDNAPLFLICTKSEKVGFAYLRWGGMKKIGHSPDNALQRR